jgi:methyl-accepting chemotaxis protein
MAYRKGKDTKTQKADKKITIQGKIMSSVLILLAISMILLGTIASLLQYFGAQNILRQALSETVKVAAERINMELFAYQNVVTEMGGISRLSNPDISGEEKLEIVNQKVEKYGLVEGNVIGADGISVINGIDCNERAYFKAAMNGETYISDPVISKNTGKISIIIAGPLWANGETGGDIVGAVIMIPKEDFLDNIVQSIKVSDGAGAYILDSNGTAVAHTTAGLVEAQNNSIELAKTDKSLRAIANLEEKMINGDSGFGKYRFRGVSKYLSYAPIPGTRGWSLGVSAPTKDFLLTTIIGIIVTAVFVVVTLFLAIIVIRKIAVGIGTPVKQCAERLKMLAKGDLDSSVIELQTEDETGVLAKATGEIVTMMKGIIQDISHMLEEMAKGNFAVDSQAEEVYVGNYKPIIDSLKQLSSTQSITLRRIAEVSEQVSSGAEQMSGAATSLAEGTTDQASAVEQLLATVDDVAEKARDGAREASNTSESARTIGEKAQHSSRQMKEMISAMERISDASKEIANIIKTIEDIATQTNLLSLNASIEAARAGEAGKGFAVVAGEIGALANQSGGAVEDTRKLIQTAINEIKTGTQMVDSTADTLQGIMDTMDAVVVAIEAVSGSFEQQAEAIGQVNMGMEQISNVVQNNSATAEQSSATSQQLSAQAATLDELLKQFRVREQ